MDNSIYEKGREMGKIVEIDVTSPFAQNRRSLSMRELNQL